MTTLDLPRLPAAAIHDLGGRIAGEVLAPETPGYDEVRRVWNGAIDRRPGVIARCTTAADVAAAIAFARRHGLVIAVRGGGHSIPGLSVCDDGMMIDLQPMKAIEVDAERRLATAGRAWSGPSSTAAPRSEGWR